MRADDFLDGFERPSADDFLDGLSAKPGKKSPGFQLPGVMDPLGINSAPIEPRISVLQGESAPFDFRRASAARRAIEDMPKTGGRRGPQSLTQAPSVDQGFVENAARVLRRAVDSINQGTSGIVRNVGDITGIDAVSDFAKASSNASRRFANQTVAPQVSIDGFTPGSIVQDLPEASENALVSIGTQAPALATGSVPAALAIMFGQSYGDSYNTARGKGLSALAAMGNATGNAGFEVIGERFGGTPGTIRALKGAIAGNEPAQVAAELAKAGLRDIPGELVTYGGQTAVNAAPVVGIGPAPTVDEFLEGAKDTVLQTIIQGGVMQGAGTGLAAARRAAGKVPQIDMRAGIDAIMGRQAGPVAPPTMPTTPESSTQSVEPVAPAAPATPPAPDMVEGIVSAIQAAAEAAVPNPRTPAATPAVEQSADDFLDQAAQQPQQSAQPAPIEPANEQPAATPDQTSVQAPDQAPAPAGQAAPSGAADTVGRTDAPAAQPQPEQQAALSPDTRLGVDGIELSQGGQPYTSKTEAQRARKLQPDLRLVKVAGGYALAPKTAAQQAAYAKAARRLGSTGNKGMPMSVHEFLAARGGLAKGTMSDLGFDRNMRIGARWLFARNGGMSFEQAAEALQQAGYTQESDLAKVINLIQRSARYQPQYTPEGFEQLAELERERDYQDYLEAQQEVGDDPFAPLEDMGFTEEDAQAAGFYQASPELQAEVAALAAQLEDAGRDPESIMERIAIQFPDATQQEYYERAREALTEAITQATQSGGSGNAGQDDGSQAGQGAGQQTQGAEPEGLTSYTREDIERRQDQQAQAQRQAEQQRLDQERRAQADAQVDDFVLTGSDRDADVAAARGQGGLFDQPAESPQLKAVLDQLSAMGDAVAGMREALTNGAQSAAGQSQAAKKASAKPQPTDANGSTSELLRDAAQERGGSTEVNEEVKPYGDEGKRVLQREPGNLLPREQKAFDDFLATRSPADAQRIRDNLAKHKGTPWAKQAVEGIFVRQAMRLLMQGKTPDFQSSMDSANVANVRKTLLERGIDGAWARVELDGGLMGAAAKPVNNVNSSFINCDPSADCAKYCYATSGNYRYANTIVKSELVTLLVEMDPVRAARRVAAEYKATGEFMMNKALRLFDKGDGNESWLPFIKELNRQGVRAHIFSKNPQFLRQVPEQNLRLLSIDDSNLELADQNQDLPVAFVYSGRDQLEALARLSARDQIQVVLPVKVGQRVLDGSEIIDIKQTVPEVKPYLCPIDSGFKKLGKPGQQGTWNCTSCDKNGGIGCFHGTPTKAIMESAEVKPVPQQVKAQRILELKRKINEITAAPGGNLAEAGRVRPGQLEGLLSEVDALLGDLLRGYDAAAEGQAAGGSGPGTDQAGDGSRGPVSRRRVIPIRAARADASGRRDDGNDELSEPPRAEAPRGRYTDDRQLQLFVDNGPVESQAGPAAEAAQRDAVSAVDDLRSTGNVLALALSRDYAARQRVNLVGQQVKTPEDLAILAQVYRDPRFETFRVFFTNDAGQVVSQVGLTSRLPASTQAIMGDDMDAYLAELSGIARNRGATGYYLLHNHPSGQATPSRADLVLTRAFAEKMPMLTFKSHVVIDTNEYSTIDRNGKPQKFEKDFGQPAPFRDQEWVDVRFTGPDDLMSMARRLQVDDDAITLIHTDNQYNVKAISTIPNAASFLSKDELKKQVVKASLQVRGSQLFAVSRDDLSLYRIGSMVVDAIHVKDSGQVVSLRANGAIGGGTPLPEKRRTRLSPDSSPEFGYLRKRYLPMSQKEAGRRVAEPSPRLDQVDTPAFRRWFGDSKVVDSSGKPLVVYHGTTSDIEKFQSKAAMTGWDIQNNGIYFTADPGYADAYARGKGSEKGNREGSNLVPVYLSIQNPLVIEPNESDFDKRFSSSYYSPDAVRELKAQGYDGVINYALDEFVVFDATQVKSAIGNNGQFDPANPSIVRDDDGQYQASSQRQPGRSLNPFGRDQLGRVKFKAGEAALAKFGQVIKPVLDKTGMTMASPELRRQLRAMKTTIEEANRNAAEVAKQMAGLSEADRILVSDIVEKSLKTGVVPPDHAVKIADAISKAMDRQTDELLELGMLTPASAERWRGRYLPRLYLKGTPSEDASFWRRLFKLDGTLRGIRGDNLKARGLFETVSVDEAEQWLRLGWELRDQHWKLKQGKLELVDKNAPVAAREKVVVWRDWTDAERENMGEIRDAMLRYIEGYTAMQRDIALGRLFNNIASNTEWVRRSPSAGWIRVPDTEIPNTAGVKRYGNLAGLYVKQDVMTHLTQFEEAANDSLQLWREALGLWKEGKTALNPVAHFNNVMSNISMAHFAGVSYWDGHKYLAAVRDLVKGDDKVEAARKAGLFTGSFTKEELVQSMPPELQKLMNLPEGAARKAGRQVMNAITLWLRQPMRAAYEAEDTFFKYLIWRDARQRGMSDEEAADYALRYIFTYDDLPAGARKVRDFAIPFFAWTYKAIPALLHTAMVYPWRFLAPAAALHGINLAAYALAAGDEDDDWLEKIAKGRELEAEEREVLPDRMKGLSALGNPKHVRLGTDSLTGNPIFLDVSRVIPGGDMFDMENQAGGLPIPAPLMPNHPVLTVFSAMVVNKEMWMGKEVVDENDTAGEAAAKRARWMAGFLLPAVSPGGYHSQRILDATAAAADTVISTPLGDFTGIDRGGQPVQPKYAAMQTVGIKARPIDLELEGDRRRADDSRLAKSIAAEVRSLARLHQRGAISDRAFEEGTERAREKMDRMRE